MKVRRERILVRLCGEKRTRGSIVAWTATFVNAIMQSRQIAFDGQRWFCQPNRRASFVQVGESEVPPNVKKEMSEAIKEIQASRTVTESSPSGEPFNGPKLG